MAKGLTEKEAKTVNELVKKALDKDKPNLSPEEVKTLQSLLKKLYGAEQKAKDEKASLSEIIDITAEKSLVNLALKKHKEKAFAEKPLQAKHEELAEQIEKLKNSQLAKFGEKKRKEEKETAERAEFEKWYSAYTVKHGKVL